MIAAAHRYKKKRFTLNEYLRERHIVVAVEGGLQTLVDRPLAERGHARAIHATMPYFIPAAMAVEQTSSVLTLPGRLARIVQKLTQTRLVKAPPELPAFAYLMLWHPRLEAEPVHMWLRRETAAVAKEIG